MGEVQVQRYRGTEEQREGRGGRLRAPGRWGRKRRWGLRVLSRWAGSCQDFAPFARRAPCSSAAANSFSGEAAGEEGPGPVISVVLQRPQRLKETKNPPSSLARDLATW